MALFPGMDEIKQTLGLESESELESANDLADESRKISSLDHKAQHAAYMARALSLAKKGIYTTHPNPRVGCVIVKDNQIVGEGWHEFAGNDHAEIVALKKAGKRAEGATVYVTLEPCCHHGRTPPCSTALIKAKVKTVVIATEDPNPLVNRGGISDLQRAGIEVISGVAQNAAKELNKGFIKRVTTGLPWVTLKIAVSMDGKTALQSGESQWITSEPARMDAHKLRARSSAILTGVGTVLRDDPRMTARVDGVERQPLRVVLDSRLSTPMDAKILHEPGNVLLITTDESFEDDSDYQSAYQSKNVEVITLERKHGMIDIQAVMAELGKREVNELMLEAGAFLSGSMLKQGLVDECVIYMSPDLLGSESRGMFDIPGISQLSQRINFNFHDIRRVGRDCRITLRTS